MYVYFYILENIRGQNSLRHSWTDKNSGTGSPARQF